MPPNITALTGSALRLSDPALLCSFQNTFNLITGILTKALSKMGHITETGGHMAMDQVVRNLVDELSPVCEYCPRSRVQVTQITS